MQAVLLVGNEGIIFKIIVYGHPDRFYSSPAVVVPRMINEPMLSFSRDSSERKELQNVQTH